MIALGGDMRFATYHLVPDWNPKQLARVPLAALEEFTNRVLEMSEDELLKIRNVGEKSLTELRDKLGERGIAQPKGELPADTLTEDAAEPGGGKTLTSLADLSLADLGDLIVSGDAPVAMAPAAGEGEDLRVWIEPCVARDVEQTRENLELLARYGAISKNELRRLLARLDAMEGGDVAMTPLMTNEIPAGLA